MVRQVSLPWTRIMTSIKPPGAPGAGGPIGPTSGVKDTSKPSFDQTMKNVQQSPNVEQSANAQANQTNPIDALQTELVEKLRSGEISAENAADALVKSMLDSPMASNLNATGKAELATFLKSMLSDDPNLSRIMQQLSRK